MRGNYKHGHSPNFDQSPEYKAWQAMKRRCSGKTKDAPLYSGRGILVCPEWATDFPAFLRHVGLRPGPGYGYEPGNVRWATATEQARNRRSTRVDAFDVRLIRFWKEKGYTQSAIAKAFEMSQSMVSNIVRGEYWGDVQ